MDSKGLEDEWGAEEPGLATLFHPQVSRQQLLPL
jgi:hypothetical protein